MVLRKLRIEGISLIWVSLSQNHSQYVNNEMWDTFLLSSGLRQGCSLPFLVSGIVEVLTNVIRQGKEVKD